MVVALQTTPEQHRVSWRPSWKPKYPLLMITVLTDIDNHETEDHQCSCGRFLTVLANLVDLVVSSEREKSGWNARRLHADRLWNHTEIVVFVVLNNTRLQRTTTSRRSTPQQHFHTNKRQPSRSQATPHIVGFFFSQCTGTQNSQVVKSTSAITFNLYERLWTFVVASVLKWSHIGSKYRSGFVARVRASWSTTNMYDVKMTV